MIDITEQTKIKDASIIRAQESEGTFLFLKKISLLEYSLTRVTIIESFTLIENMVYSWADIKDLFTVKRCNLFHYFEIPEKY